MSLKKFKSWWPLARRSAATPDAATANVAVFNDTRPAGHYGCDLVMHELIRLLKQPDRAGRAMQPIWFHPVGEDWRSKRDEIAGLHNLAAVIVNGEGSIHHSATRPRAVYLPEVASLARDTLNVPSFLINCTVQDIHEPVAEHLRQFAHIYVRESASQRELAQWGLQSTLVPDLTVQAELPIAPQRQGVCGTDSVLVDAARAIRSLCQNRKWPFRSMLWKHKSPDALPAPAGSVEGMHEFASFLSSHQLVITGRFHAVTYCLATRTPFVALESNTAKISSLLRDVFGSADRVLQAIDADSFDSDQYSHWSDAEARALDAYLASARQSTAEMFSAISAAAHHQPER